MKRSDRERCFNFLPYMRDYEEHQKIYINVFDKARFQEFNKSNKNFKYSLLNPKIKSVTLATSRKKSCNFLQCIGTQRIYIKGNKRGDIVAKLPMEAALGYHMAISSSNYVNPNNV